MTRLKTELIDILANQHKFQEAADLLCQLPNYQISQAVEYYNKANAFMQAIRESMKEQNIETRAALLNSIKNSVSLSYDVKKNQFLKLLDDFSKRYLRLKIVQHNKSTMALHMPSMNQGGLGFDADQMSMSGASSFSESQQSSTSGRSSSSSFSQTSKKSKRVTEKKKKKKMRKARVVKEGSPFEEDNLIELLKEEIKISVEEKE